MRQRPITASAIDPAAAQQERKQLLAFATQIVRCRLARSHKVTNRFVDRIRNPHRGEFAGSVQPGQGDRVPPVGLDALARSLRDQSWRNHRAVMAHASDLAAQRITGRACFEADMQPVVPSRQATRFTPGT